jgi:hypothetical protein
LESSKIPTPEFIVVYNGREPYPDKKVLHLSDAFITREKSPALELVATVYNVAEGHNREVLSKSRALSDYSVFVSMVENYRRGGVSLDEAITKTILECKRQGIMTAYLESRGSEVLTMLVAEWNWDDALRVAREEEREIGEEIGERRGEKRGEKLGEARLVRNMALKGRTAAHIADETGLALEYVESIVATQN